MKSPPFVRAFLLYFLVANDHYVPRFYLKNFKAAVGKLWCYERGVRPSLMGVRSVACIEEYYSIKAKHLEKDKRHIDKFITQLESSAAPLYKRFIESDKKIILTTLQKENLSIFFAHLVTRNPNFRETTKNIGMAIYKEIAKTNAENSKVVEEAKIEFFIEESEGADDWHLGTELEMTLILSNILRKKSWHIVESSTSRVFITSDNPVTLLPPSVDFDFRRGLGFENAIVALPLTPKRCLLMSDRPGRADIIQVGRPSVNEVNEKIIYNAHKQVFSNLLSKEHQGAFDKTVEGANTKVAVE